MVITIYKKCSKRLSIRLISIVLVSLMFLSAVDCNTTSNDTLSSDGSTPAVTETTHETASSGTRGGFALKESDISGDYIDRDYSPYEWTITPTDGGLLIGNSDGYITLPPPPTRL